jgi:hypothetical protein
LPPGDTEGVLGLCLDPHDLAIAKYVARREKDVVFNGELARRGIVDEGRLPRPKAPPGPLAEFLFGRGDFEAGARAYELAADSDESDSGSAAMAALLYTHTGRCAEARRNAMRSDHRARKSSGAASLTLKALKAARECQNP